MRNICRRIQSIFFRVFLSQPSLPSSETGIRFDELNDFALHQIFSKCDAESIEALRSTCQNFARIIKANRYYGMREVLSIIIKRKRMGRRLIRLQKKDGTYMKKIIKKGALNATISSWNPESLFTFDHEELLHMCPMWWRNRKRIFMWDIVDHRKYSAHFDRCTYICLFSYSRMNLTDFLESMKMNNLISFTVYGDGKLECTDENLRKIGRLFNKMNCLHLSGMTQSSIITNDGVLDMIEIGSFEDFRYYSKIQNFENMEECLKKREWASKYIRYSSTSIDIKSTNGYKYCIQSF